MKKNLTCLLTLLMMIFGTATSSAQVTATPDMIGDVVKVMRPMLPMQVTDAISVQDMDYDKSLDIFSIDYAITPKMFDMMFPNGTPTQSIDEMAEPLIKMWNNLGCGDDFNFTMRLRYSAPGHSTVTVTISKADMIRVRKQMADGTLNTRPFLDRFYDDLKTMPLPQRIDEYTVVERVYPINGNMAFFFAVDPVISSAFKSNPATLEIMKEHMKGQLATMYMVYRNDLFENHVNLIYIYNDNTTGETVGSIVFTPYDIFGE